MTCVRKLFLSREVKFDVSTVMDMNLIQGISQNLHSNPVLNRVLQSGFISNMNTLDFKQYINHPEIAYVFLSAKGYNPDRILLDVTNALNSSESDSKHKQSIMDIHSM